MEKEVRMPFSIPTSLELTPLPIQIQCTREDSDTLSVAISQMKEQQQH